MSCNINSAIQLGCATHVGGISEVYIANYTGTTTYALDATYDNIVTGITSGPATWYTYEQVSESAEYTSEGTHQNGNGGNGANFWTSTLNLMFRRKDAELRNQLLLMARGNITVIVKQNDGKYYLMGQESPAYVTATSLSTGKAYGDGANTLSIEDKTTVPSYEVSATVVAGLTIV